MAAATKNAGPKQPAQLESGWFASRLPAHSSRETDSDEQSPQTKESRDAQLDTNFNEFDYPFRGRDTWRGCRRRAMRGP